MYIYKVSHEYGYSDHEDVDGYFSSYQEAVKELKSIVCMEYYLYNDNYDYETFFRAMAEIKIFEDEKIDKVNPTNSLLFYRDGKPYIYMSGNKSSYMAYIELIKVEGKSSSDGVWEKSAYDKATDLMYSN